MSEIVILDPATLRVCAKIARQSADGIPPRRAHFNVAIATLRSLADTFDSLADPQSTAATQ